MRIVPAVGDGDVPARTPIPMMALRHLRAAGLVEYGGSTTGGRMPPDVALSDEARFTFCLE
ncbi:MAG: hypothetical protein V9G12_01890 [Microthrixaceae bacterium]